MNATMRALVLTAPNELTLKDVPIPVPALDEVLIRVRACGICGSDVHGLDGRTGRRIPPLIMGHEAAGEVAGDGQPDWPAGTRVTFDSTLYCGECPSCCRGAVNLCDRRQVIGVSCAEYRRNGAFAEYACVPTRTLHRLPPKLSFEHAALAEPIAVALHAVNRSPLIQPGATAAVVGTGLIGLLIIQMLRARGIERIIAIDIDESRLALAKRLGASATADSRQLDIEARLLAITNGRGADSVFEVVGIATTLRLAVSTARRGGDVILVGNLSPQVDLPLQAVVTREIRLLGSCASAGEYPAGLALIASGQVDTHSFITATPPLEEGPNWFRRLQTGEKELMKVVLCP